jgi:serine/threonine-protein kinase RsbT
MADPLRIDLAQKGRALRLAARRNVARPEVRRRAPVTREEPLLESATLVPDTLEVRVLVDGEQGLIEARRQGRELASRGGFRVTDRAVVAAIVSELGRNILLYATAGEISLKLIQENERIGMLISARDSGPGIPDLGRALRDGFSTSGRLGIGLPGVRRLADEFDIGCAPGCGTAVSVRKWRS